MKSLSYLLPVLTLCFLFFSFVDARYNDLYDSPIFIGNKLQNKHSIIIEPKSEEHLKSYQHGNFDTVEQTLNYHAAVVECKAGYTLLSCGINHGDIKQNQDTSFYSSCRPYSNLAYTHPIDSSSCACFSFSQNPKIKCQANCYKSDQNTVNSNSKFLHTSYISLCPQNKKVLGCHMHSSYDTSNKDTLVERYFYPLSDRQGCFCKDLRGAKCIATCGNVEDHQIVKSEYGKDTVTCSEGTYATGCGVKQAFDKDASITFPSAYVSSPNKCSCIFREIETCPFFHSFSSSYFPSLSTCYAICASKLSGY